MQRFMLWSPEILVFLLVALTLICALTAAIVTVINTLKHATTQQLLRITQQELALNTATTEHTVIQLQNTTRAVRQTEHSLTDQTRQLEELVDNLRAQNEALALKVAQAQMALREIDVLHVALKTAERQAVFDREIASLKALLQAQSHAAPLPPPEGS